MPSFGPLYCETGHAFGFIAEPVNFVSNAAIILAAVLGFLAIRNMGGKRPYDLYLLTLVLFLNGIGSAWWHGFRTPMGLAFDVAPGIIFLFFFTYLWMRKLYGPIAGIAGLLGLIGAVWMSSLVIGSSELPRLFPVFGSVLVVGALFVAFTYKRFGKWFAMQGAIVLAFALMAAICRTIDLTVCGILPIGTHFLWHILLSTAAYFGIVFLIKLDRRQE